MTETALLLEDVAIHAVLARRRHEVERVLRLRLAPAPGGPARLAAAMDDAVFPGGKRWRPLLVFAAAELAGAPWRSALPQAAAVELLHCASLVFDDLPCMDDAALRRGRPALHRAHGEGIAVLAGIGLLTTGLGILAEQAVGGGADASLAARYVGVGEMLGGQAFDLARREPHPAPGVPAEAVNRKTTALVELALALGARRGRLDPGQEAALLEYGRELGLAYQEMDDLADGEGPAANDLASRAIAHRIRATAALEENFPPGGARDFLHGFACSLVRAAA